MVTTKTVIDVAELLYILRVAFDNIIKKKFYSLILMHLFKGYKNTLIYAICEKNSSENLHNIDASSGMFIRLEKILEPG